MVSDSRCGTAWEEGGGAGACEALSTAGPVPPCPSTCEGCRRLAAAHPQRSVRTKALRGDGSAKSHCMIMVAGCSGVLVA